MKKFSKALILSLMVGSVITGIVSCERSDDEPPVTKGKIGRLYISFSNYRDGATPFPTIGIIDNADSVLANGGDMSTIFKLRNISITSGVKGGATLYFDPFVQRIYQSPKNENGLSDTVLRHMSYNLNGIPASTNSIQNSVMGSVRGMAINIPENNNEPRFLYVTKTSRTGINRDVQPVGIYKFNSAIANGYVRYGQKITLAGLGEERAPWGLAINGKTLYASISGPNGGVMVLPNVVNNLDTLLADYSNTQMHTIAGASKVRGISYHLLKDILVLTDYKGEGPSAVGKIYIIENFSKLPAGEITPTRTIQGASTGLIEPVDVSIDKRANGTFMFVVDKSSRYISRFKITDNGNVAPDARLKVDKTPETGINVEMIPEGIYFDGRD
ncbi:hypothetical protein [Sphingobacterium spiritivorum]|uniref:hypothetical protein n=1 Tax=Sphingobacterium spiritivorum TaxID=258 RepID=UPI003DA29AE7